MFDTMLQYYGLDWAGMLLGMTGCYFVTQQNRVGFLFQILACLCGFTVAAMSAQYGYVLYNAMFICMTMHGYNKWPRKEARVVALGAE